MKFEPPRDEPWPIETTFRWLEDAARFLLSMGIELKNAVQVSGTMSTNLPDNEVSPSSNRALQLNSSRRS